MSAPTTASGTELPFTGSVLTVPLAILGLLLTMGGFVLRKTGMGANRA